MPLASGKIQCDLLISVISLFPKLKCIQELYIRNKICETDHNFEALTVVVGAVVQKIQCCPVQGIPHPISFTLSRAALTDGSDSQAYYY